VKRAGWPVCHRCMKEHLKAQWVCRANIKTASSIDPYGVALRQNVFGLGWRIDDGKTGMSWESYEHKAKKKYRKHLTAWKRHMAFLRDNLR
jgi:hypothetical protein